MGTVQANETLPHGCPHRTVPGSSYAAIECPSERKYSAQMYSNTVFYWNGKGTTVSFWTCFGAEIMETNMEHSCQDRRAPGHWSEAITVESSHKKELLPQTLQKAPQPYFRANLSARPDLFVLMGRSCLVWRPRWSHFSVLCRWLAVWKTL